MTDCGKIPGIDEDRPDAAERACTKPAGHVQLGDYWHSNPRAGTWNEAGLPGWRSPAEIAEEAAPVEAVAVEFDMDGVGRDIYRHVLTTEWRVVPAP